MKNNIRAYYNEWDKDAAAWLRQLIKDGLITDGVVDERSITEVIASDIRGFDRVHWFAGIGTWDCCLTQAGWGDRPVWTASLPCQPFSAAGKQLGKADERNLLPHFLELVKECRPGVVFGEQVARAISVTGQLRNQDKDLQLLQKKQAYIRVLAELQRSNWKGVRGMPEYREIKEEIEKRGKFIELQKLEKGKQGKCSGKCCEAQSEGKGDGVGHYIGMGAREDRSRLLRGDGDILRFRHAEIMECAVTGQNKQRDRLYEGKREGCYLRSERDDEYMGGAKDFGCCGWDHASASEEIRRAYRVLNEQIEGSVPRGWLDDLHAEMEAEDYAVGHCVFGAHSIGAAHIRQRLYWVAHSISKGLQGHGQSGIEQIQERRERTQRHSAKGGDASGMGITNINGREQGSEITKAARYRNTVDAAGGIDWLYCRDGKYRPVKSGIKPLVNGSARGMVRGSDQSEEEIKPNETAEAHAMRLKGYGNAIVSGCAIEFIKTFMEYQN